MTSHDKYVTIEFKDLVRIQVFLRQLCWEWEILYGSLKNCTKLLLFFLFWEPPKTRNILK